MTDKEMLELVYSLNKLDEYRKKQIVLLLLSTTLNTFAAEELAGFMVGLSENIEEAETH
jgi:hypothetical protein